MAYITDTWEEINRKCAEGLAESAYALGDLKTITLDWGSSTEEIDMEIIGFNHDDLSDGSGKAAITFFSKQLLKDYKAMSGTHANTGGWAGNYSLRSWCNNTLYFALPSDLKPLIKEVTKLSDGGQNSTSLISTNDKCWFASPMEVASSWSITTLDGQGVRYEHTMTTPEGANAWRTKAKKGGVAHHWWLRSSTTNNYRWGFVGNTGWPSYDNASNKFGIAFGFCVGVVSNEPEEPTTIVYTIEHNTLTSFADQARRIGGTTDKLTPSQMLGIFEGASGSGGGSASLNIHYGDTEPTDTSKLWCKCSEPSSVLVSSRVSMGEELLNTNVGELPTSIYAIKGVAVGTKIYLFGGWGAVRSNKIFVFDTKTKIAEELSVTLPTSMSGMGIGAVGNKIYLFGGKTGSVINTVYMFDVKSNEFTTLSTKLPQTLMGMASVTVGTKIYLFGGMSSSESSYIYKFDTETETINTLTTTLPVALTGLVAEAVGTKIYVFGGLRGDYRSAIYKFDTETDSIETLTATLPSGGINMATGVIGNDVYMFGGATTSANPSSVIVKFNSETESVETMSLILPIACRESGCATVGTKIYLFGGYSSGATNSIHEFSKSCELEHSNLLLQSSLNENLFDILNGDTTVEIGVKTVYLGNSDGEGEPVDSYLYKDGAWTQI